MGVISRMREISPYMLGAIAILFIVFMVISDIDPQSLSQGNRMSPDAAIGSVNGEDIRAQEFEARVKEQIEAQRNQYAQQGQEAPEIDEDQIRQSIWDQMVEEILVRQEARRTGVEVSNEELLDVLLDDPPSYLRQSFTDSTGYFHKDRYLQLVTNPNKLKDLIGNQQGIDANAEVAKFKEQLVKVEDYILRERLTNGVRAVVNTAGAIVSPTALRQHYMNENSSAEVSFVAFDINKIPDTQVKVSDEEIKNYYEKNKEYYIQKPTRKVKYVTFPLDPSKVDSNIARKKIATISERVQSAPTQQAKDSVFAELAETYGGKSNDFTLVNNLDPQRQAILASMQAGEVRGPVELPGGTYFIKLDETRTGQQESFRASHILLAFGANKDSAKKEAEKILQRVKSGEDFSKLAMQYSTDKGSGMQGGDLGYFGKGRMVKEFENAIVSSAPGSVVGPVETQFGWHIIKVTDKTSSEMKFTEIPIPITMSSATRNNLYREAFSFKTQIENGANFDTLAKKLNKNAVETVAFESNAPVLGSRKVTDFAFENEAGAVSSPIDLKYYGVAVIQVTQARQAGIRSLEDMKDELKARIIRVKKLDMLKGQAQQFYSKVASLDSLSKAAQFVPGTDVRSAANVRMMTQVPGVGIDVAFTGAALSRPVGKISEPVRGEHAYYVMQVHNRTMADPNQLKMNYKSAYDQAAGTARAAAYRDWLVKTKETSKIKDNRKEFYGGSI